MRSLRSAPQWRRLTVGSLVILAAFVCVVPLAFGFPDVTPDHPYGVAIEDLAERNVIKGFADGSFRPDEPVVRQQFAKMVLLALDRLPTERTVCPFPDVEELPGALYPYRFVGLAAELGITRGMPDGCFHPYENITRAQVITMVVRALGSLYPGVLIEPPGSYFSTWGPFDPTHAHAAAVAEFNGLLAGLPLEGLEPFRAMPRGEVAQVLHNWLASSQSPSSTSGSSTTLPTTTTTTSATSTTTNTATTSTSTTSGSTTTGSTSTTESSTTTTSSAPSRTISGQIRDTHGNPVSTGNPPGSDGTIYVYTINGTKIQDVVVGAEGRYEVALPAGRYLLKTWRAFGQKPCIAEWYDDHAEDRFTWQDATVVDVTLASVSNIDFELEFDTGIDGTVRDQYGNPIADAWVAVCSAASNVNAYVRTEADGSYSSGFLQPGTYKVKTDVTGYVNEWYDDLPVATHTWDQAATLTLSSLAPRISGVDFVLSAP